ncbi:MAG: protein YgfX [Salinisphaeraceae bacterium]|nr:protein YgfX [Salinisphaeraceae bacterium]
METCIELKPRPSHMLAMLLAGFHALVVVVVIWAVPYKPAMAALILLTVLSWYRAYRVHICHLGRHAVRRLQWQADGSWLLADEQGEMRPAQLLPSSYLHRRLVILNFRLRKSGRRRNVVLLPDSLDFETLRHLRVRLRTQAAAQQSAGLNRA